MSVYGGPDIVTDGLVLCLDAANPDSYPGTGNVWYDLSSSKKNASISGAVFTSNKFTFNGADSVTFNDTSAEDCSPTGSIEIILKTISPSTSQEILFLTDNRDRAIFIHDNKYKASAYNATDGEYKILIGSTATTNWTHAIFTYTQNNGNNAIYTFYLNGNQVDQIVTNTTTDATSDNNTNKIGIKYNNGVESLGLPARTSDFLGDLSICRFYNKVLSANEVQQNYKALKGRYGL